MREVIQDLLAAETEAKAMVQHAHEEADQIVAEAEKRARAFVTNARAETHARTQATISAMVEDAQASKRQELEKNAANARNRLRLDPNDSEAVVQALIRFICGNSTPDQVTGPTRSR